MGGGEDALVGLEVDEGLTIALREVDTQKDHRVVEKEIGRYGRHVRRGVVAEKDRVMSAVDLGGDGGAVGGIAPEDGAVVVEQLEAEFTEIDQLEREFTNVLSINILGLFLDLSPILYCWKLFEKLLRW